MNFLTKNKGILISLGIFIVLYFIYFCNLGTWALLDTDESRYVNMSRVMFETKDYMTLYVDGIYFFEKPPLYFWIESAAFGLTGVVNELVARIPTVLFALLSVLTAFLLGKKVKSTEFGVISALILASTMEFVLFAKISMLDMILTAFIMLSTMCGIITFYVKEQNKKYFWWLFYILSALGVMTKGIPAFVIPFGVMFFAGIYTRKLKEYFRPQYFLVGFLVFFLIVLPWHILMLNMYNPEFFNEYIVKHHLMRYIGSKEEIGRVHGFYYYIPVMLLGLLPWTFSFLSGTIVKIKNDGFKALDKFYVINLIGFVFVFMFFSCAGTKLVTYILPVYLFTAFLTAYVWERYIKDGEYRRSVEISTYVTMGILILAGALVALSSFIVPLDIYTIIKNVQIKVALLLIVLPLLAIVLAATHKRFALFVVNILFIALISAFGMPAMLNTWYKFGQNDLMEFAKYAKENHELLKLERIGERFSISYYYSKAPIYLPPLSAENVEFNIQEGVMIIENDVLDKIKNDFEYKLIKEGIRYSLITKKD